VKAAQQAIREMRRALAEEWYDTPPRALSGFTVKESCTAKESRCVVGPTPNAAAILITAQDKIKHLSRL
jgi:hypothetical protein